MIEKEIAIAQYFVTMDIEEADPLLPVDQLARIVREAILPSLEALVPLTAQGRVVTGGYPIGDNFMVFVVEADSEEEVQEVLEGLSLSGVARTNVRRLHTLEDLRSPDGHAP